MSDSARVRRVADAFAGGGVPVRDLEMLDALLDLIDDNSEAEARFMDGLTGDSDVRAGAFVEAMIAWAERTACARRPGWGATRRARPGK